MAQRSWRNEDKERRQTRRKDEVKSALRKEKKKQEETAATFQSKLLQIFEAAIQGFVIKSKNPKTFLPSLLWIFRNLTLDCQLKANKAIFGHCEKTKECSFKQSIQTVFTFLFQKGSYF